MTTGVSHSTSGSQHSDTQEILMWLRRLATFVPNGAAGSVTPALALSVATSQSSIEEPPSTLGILPWILDSGAFFSYDA